jgi:hypothetical protein
VPFAACGWKMSNEADRARRRQIASLGVERLASGTCQASRQPLMAAVSLAQIPTARLLCRNSAGRRVGGTFSVVALALVLGASACTKAAKPTTVRQGQACIVAKPRAANLPASRDGTLVEGCRHEQRLWLSRTQCHALRHLAGAIDTKRRPFTVASNGRVTGAASVARTGSTYTADASPVQHAIVRIASRLPMPRRSQCDCRKAPTSSTFNPDGLWFASRASDALTAPDPLGATDYGGGNLLDRAPPR